jgi:ring-1,2-phenylacetyl-CoA epoxidase subunit PaaB
LDTQWPRYIVFQQDEPGAPYHYDGSVHASDAELALLNARDVFTRRPDCIGLWVVRADRVFSRTIEELAADPAWAVQPELPGETEPYTVFQKRDHKGAHSSVGEVEATSPEGALREALRAFPDEKVTVWWVCPSRAITRSAREDIDALFQMSDAPRFYREQDEFKTLTALRRAAGKNGDNAPHAS